jgi:hypothetical protein
MIKMGKKIFPSDVLNQAQGVLTAWNQIDQSMAFGSLNVEVMTATVSASREVEAEISRLETLLTDKRNQRDELHSDAWDMVKRARSGIKAAFGDDSFQYDMIGGTRISDRKSSARKVAA